LSERVLGFNYNLSITRLRCRGWLEVFACALPIYLVGNVVQPVRNRQTEGAAGNVTLAEGRAQQPRTITPNGGAFHIIEGEIDIVVF
jgi:hypothetical protein